MEVKKQEVLFKNVTTYNKKNYEQFLEFHNKRYNFSYNLYTIIMALLLAFCIILNIKQKNIGLIIFFLSVFIGFIFLRKYLPMRRYKNTQENLRNSKNTNYTFQFYKFNFKIENKLIYYFKLYKVFETKEYFYLYINENYALMLNKNGFEIGSLDDFRKFIKEKCLLKYRKYI